MKKSKLEAAETRRRIVRTAAAEFRRNGITGTGLSDLMAAAGLTHGGFYRHFGSKDQLVAEACAAGMQSVVETTQAAAAHRTANSGLQAIAESYLSTDHRDNQSEGCPLVDVVARQYRRTKPDVAKARALVALSAMIGAVTMSRIVTDPKLSAAILQQTKKHLANT
jgi:TetR/AcrR family transcriptional repressor of nem operon